MKITLKTMTAAVAAPGLVFSLSACSGGSETGETVESGAKTEAVSSDMPSAATGKSSGTLVGTVAGHALSLEGTCSASEDSFEFWSDGKDFAVNNDSNGDGQYLNVSVVTMNDRTMAAMRFQKDGEKIYNGTVPYSTSGDANMTVRGPLGREQAISADFTVNCG